MNEIARHIENLLLEHKCVIVPHLGGFVTQYVSARCIEDEKLFLPPYRSVGFNPQLIVNDGLLVQSYMRVYDTSYTETIQMIEDAVFNLKTELQQNGCYELNGVGTLSLNIDGRYNFRPINSGILAPELFGLDVIPIQELNEKQVALRNQVATIPNKKNYTISINREPINYTVAAIIAIVCYFFVWGDSFILNNDSQPYQAAVVPLVEHIDKEVDVKVKDTLAHKQRKVTDLITVNKQVEEDHHQQAANVPTSYYTIVLASSVNKKNAKAFIKQLRSDGFQEGKILSKPKMNRVVYGKYATAQEAQKALTLHKQDSRFEQGWILQVPKLSNL